MKHNDRADSLSSVFKKTSNVMLFKGEIRRGFHRGMGKHSVISESKQKLEAI